MSALSTYVYCCHLTDYLTFGSFSNIFFYFNYYFCYPTLGLYLFFMVQVGRNVYSVQYPEVFGFFYIDALFE